MKLDAETLRKLALAGARTRLKELESESEKLRDVIRQLTGATVPPDGRRSVAKAMKSKAPMRHAPGRTRKNRKYTEKFKAAVVKEANEANNASAVGKKHNVSPSLVRLWVDKAK